MSKKKQRSERKEQAETAASSAQARWTELLVRGDYRAARSEASKSLTESTVPEPDKVAAQEVIARTSVDPRTLAAGLVLASLLIAIIALVFF